MRRVVAAVVVMSLPARAASAQASATPRSSPTWEDAGWVAAAGALYVLPGALGLPQGAPSCAPCDPATLPGFDRWAVRPVVHGADVASSAVLLGVAGWTALAGLQGLPADRWRDNVARCAAPVRGRRRGRRAARRGGPALSQRRRHRSGARRRCRVAGAHYPSDDA